jgi:hypothetical protein
MQRMVLVLYSFERVPDVRLDALSILGSNANTRMRRGLTCNRGDDWIATRVANFGILNKGISP